MAAMLRAKQSARPSTRTRRRRQGRRRGPQGPLPFAKHPVQPRRALEPAAGPRLSEKSTSCLSEGHVPHLERVRYKHSIYHVTRKRCSIRRRFGSDLRHRGAAHVQAREGPECYSQNLRERASLRTAGGARLFYREMGRPSSPHYLSKVCAQSRPRSREERRKKRDQAGVTIVATRTVVAPRHGRL